MKLTTPQPDILTGSLRKSVIILALPVLGEQVLNSFLGIYDTFLAGRISKEATAAVGLSAYVSWLASMLFMLVGTGTTALVARLWGAGERGEANRVVGRSVALGAITGMACAVLIYLAAPTFAVLQNMRGDAFQVTVRYIRIDACSYIFYSVGLIGAAALRGAGDMRTPMLVLACVNVVNVILSTSFVFGLGPLPALGVDGIVLGTLISRTLAGLTISCLLLRGIRGLRLSTAECRVTGPLARRILQIGIPAATEGALFWVGQFIFLMLIARLGHGDIGQAMYAAHIIAIRIESLTYMPAAAWGAAAATIVGQSLGAGNSARALQAGHEANLQCASITCTSMLIFFFAAKPIFYLMHNDPMVWLVGVPAFRVVALFQPFLGLYIVYVSALKGAGDTRSPLIFSTVGVFLIRLPLAYVLGVSLELNLFGAWLAMCIEMAARAVMATARYVRGGWIATRV